MTHVLWYSIYMMIQKIIEYIRMRLAVRRALKAIRADLKAWEDRR